MWSVQHLPSSQTPPHAPNVDLDDLLHPQQRDINVGLRMTKEVEARWQGNLQEMMVEMLIDTPTYDNNLGHQL